MLEVKGDISHAAHMEEGLVLDLADARMVQIASIHKTARTNPLVILGCRVAAEGLGSFGTLT